MRILNLVDFYNKLRAAGLPDVLSWVDSQFIFYTNPEESVQTAFTGTITGIVLHYVESNEQVTREEFEQDKFSSSLKEMPQTFGGETGVQLDLKKEIPVARFHFDIQCPNFNPTFRHQSSRATPQEITLNIYLSDYGEATILTELWCLKQEDLDSKLEKIEGTLERLADFLGKASQWRRDGVPKAFRTK